MVELYNGFGCAMFDRMNEFFKRKAEIDLEYAKAIQKLVKGQKDEIAKKIGDKVTGPVYSAVMEGYGDCAFVSC